MDKLNMTGELMIKTKTKQTNLKRIVVPTLSGIPHPRRLSIREKYVNNSRSLSQQILLDIMILPIKRSVHQLVCFQC